MPGVELGEAPLLALEREGIIGGQDRLAVANASAPIWRHQPDFLWKPALAKRTARIAPGPRCRKSPMPFIQGLSVDRKPAQRALWVESRDVAPGAADLLRHTVDTGAGHGAAALSSWARAFMRSSATRPSSASESSAATARGGESSTTTSASRRRGPARRIIAPAA